jgi:hypothetical protein
LTVQVKLQTNDVPNFKIQLNEQSKVALFAKRPSVMKVSAAKSHSK